MRRLPALLALSTAGLLLVGAGAGAEEPDPLASVNWDGVRQALFGTDPVVFDVAHVHVEAPRKVESGGQVPVAVRIEGLKDVHRIMVLADLDPAPRAVTFVPGEALPRLALRIKVNEATAVRAAAQTGDGVWHVAGVNVDAPGGGCTTPSVSQATQAWKTQLNWLRGETWHRPDGGDRLRFRIVHPMDTGFVSNIPAFFIEHMLVTTASGKHLAELDTAEPVSENPIFTIDLPPGASSADGYRVEWRDTDGNVNAATIPAPRRTLAEGMVK